MNVTQANLIDRFQEATAERGGPSSGAEFSPCRTYRYALWRIWDWQSHANCVMFIGCNPSTADEERNDTTISKCMGFAKKWGYGGIYMLNLYGFRATDPADLLKAEQPIGPANDEAFGYYRSRVGLVVAAWGSCIPRKQQPRMEYRARIDQVTTCIWGSIYCLGFTKDQSPRHPSRLGYDTKRELFWFPPL